MIDLVGTLRTIKNWVTARLTSGKPHNDEHHERLDGTQLRDHHPHPTEDQPGG